MLPIINLEDKDMEKQYQKPEVDNVVLETQESVTANLGVSSINPFRPVEIDLGE